jgi:hypothetical protein
MKKVLGSRVLGSRVLAFALLLLAIAAPGAPIAGQQAATQTAAAALPARLSDADFWKLVTDISEPGGYFRIVDNFTSNEREIGVIQTALRTQGPQGGVYMGVGPEQNFSYIAAVRPAMAFIVDIRRQAVMQHLMAKAIFEMAPDRAEFISLQFAKPRPATLNADTPIQETWDAFRSVATDSALAAKNYERIVDHLTKTHKFTFTADESSLLAKVYDAFVFYGPAITTQSGGGGRGGGNALNFESLTGWTTDNAGQVQSFMSTDGNYQFVKSMHEKNLIVPVSGDFGGPKTIRAIGTYLTERNAIVSAFYVSNVEQYLYTDGKARAFYDNVATLPLSDKSVFIRAYSLRNFGTIEAALCPVQLYLVAVKEGRMLSNNESLACAVRPPR